MDTVTIAKNRYKWLCENHENFTDEQFAGYIEAAAKILPVNREFFSPELNDIIRERVKDYCQAEQIKMSEYKGPLPFRYFNVELGGITAEEAKENIKKFMK